MRPLQAPLGAVESVTCERCGDFLYQAGSPVRPLGLSPAAMGVVVDGLPDVRDVAASLLDLGVRGYLTFEERYKGEWHITQVKPPEPTLPEHERARLGEDAVRAGHFVTSPHGTTGTYRTWAKLLAGGSALVAVLFGTDVPLGILAFVMNPAHGLTFGSDGIDVFTTPLVAAALGTLGAGALWAAPTLSSGHTEEGIAMRDAVRRFRDRLVRFCAEREASGEPGDADTEVLLPYAPAFQDGSAYAPAMAPVLAPRPAWLCPASEGAEPTDEELRAAIKSCLRAVTGAMVATSGPFTKPQERIGDRIFSRTGGGAGGVDVFDLFDVLDWWW